MCNFKITFKGSATDFINTVSNKIEAVPGYFKGDEMGGEFSVPTPIGSITGSYTIDGQYTQIHISKKPFLVSCQQIEKILVY